MTTAAHTFDDQPIAVPARLSQVCGGALLAIACMVCACAAHAADEQSRALAAGCASCHQPDERIPPPLAGQSRDELSAKLRGFRDGTRSGTVMPQLARGYTPAQLDAVAAWFAAQKPSRP
ncbi:MAG: c-type cytochrome [Casimicrobiaceae bacterium]